MKIKNNKPSTITLKLKLDKDKPVLTEFVILPTYVDVPKELQDLIMENSSVKQMMDDGRIDIVGYKEKITSNELKRMIREEEVIETIEEIISSTNDESVKSAGKTRIDRLSKERKARLEKDSK